MIAPGHGGILSVLLLLLLVAASSFLVVSDCHASRYGRNGFSGNPDTNGGVTCIACHASGAAVPRVKLSGPTTVNAGTTNDYTITISDGPGQSVGVNLSVSDFIGQLAPRDADLHRVGEELSHTAPKLFSGPDVSFSFQWTAPAYDTRVALYGAGNSSNNWLDLLGDGIGTDVLIISVRNGTQPPPPPPSPPPASEINLSRYATGLKNPVAIAHAGDGRLFVVEQVGRIRVINRSGQLRRKPFLNITKRVTDRGNEQGLLGLAFHPRYARTGHFYVYYTYTPPQGPDRSRVSRFRVSSDRNVAKAGSERVLLEFEQPFSNHPGGDLHFGPDGYLYIASGDGGSGGDPYNSAQDNGVLLGKLLRIDVDGSSDGGTEPDCDLSGSNGYRIPAGNAFGDGAGGLGCDEIYGNGLRNPWRFSFDRQNGDLWIADVGQNKYEEINFVSASSGGGLNFGWRCYEGNHPFKKKGCGDGYFAPVYELGRGDGDCSVTGGFVYRGFDYPALYGRYFFSDFCNTSIRTLSIVGGNPVVATALPDDVINTPATFGENARGELFVASLRGGTVYRIEGGVSGTPIGEAGSVTVEQQSASSWHWIAFRNSYDSPVVVMGPPTSNGDHPLTARVRNVTADGFEFQLQEWKYLDGWHGRESIGYLVVEAGEHTLLDGTRLKAGVASVDHRWQRLNFPTPFASRPVVLVQVGSFHGGWTVSERLRNVGTSGFAVRLQEEEAADGVHLRENLDWIALEVGVGARHDVGLTGAVIDHQGKTVTLKRSFPDFPVLLASIQSMQGVDPAALRRKPINARSLVLYVEEEQSEDSEVLHTNPENVGYAAFLPGEIRAR